MRLISREKKEELMQPIRKRLSIANRLYNHLIGINVEHSLHTRKQKRQLKHRAQVSLDALLTPTDISDDASDIPKIIWMFWDSGFDGAPEVVQLSVKSWQEMNPDYEVRLLTNDNLKQYLGFDFQAIFQLATVRCLPATKADLLRLHLLSKHGGVWVDATTFCLTPLGQWLPSAIEHCGIFNFRHKYDVSCPVEAWFIASPKSARIINKVLKLMTAYIFKPRALTLFISGRSLTTKDRPLDSTITIRGESQGFMPYFTIGYFFHDVLKEELSEEQFNLFLSTNDTAVMTNQHAALKDDFTIFQQSLTSKQTYTRRYMASELFKKRKAFLIERLAQQHEA